MLEPVANNRNGITAFFGVFPPERRWIRLSEAGIIGCLGSTLNGTVWLVARDYHYILKKKECQFHMAVNR